MAPTEAELSAGPVVDAAIAVGERSAGPVVDASVDAGGRLPPAGFVDVATAIPDVVMDVRYATAHNLTGAPLYPVARCWLRADPAAKLTRAADLLRARGHRLIVWDCYRPASIQRELWRRLPDPRFVARPRDDDQGRPIAGSTHSRGGAVDVSLADSHGTPRAMPTDHDAFGPAASGAAARGPARQYLADLRAAMRDGGYRPLPSEWWHFEADGAATAPLVDEPFE